VGEDSKGGKIQKLERKMLDRGGVWYLEDAEPHGVLKRLRW